MFSSMMIRHNRFHQYCRPVYTTMFTKPTAVATLATTTVVVAFSSSASSASSVLKPKAIFLNASRLNYDNQLNFNQWDNIIDCTYHLVDRITNVNEIVELVDDCEIVILKEMIFPVEALHAIVASSSSNNNNNHHHQKKNKLKLICEAGTGYNNIPIDVAKTYGIYVCNVPTYSTHAVAHMAITYVMNFSCSMFQQQEMLRKNNDRSNFTGPFTLPLHELSNQTIGLLGGAGRIGTVVAQIAVALQMNVVISSRSGVLPDTHPLKNHPNVVCTSNVTILLQQSDYVSIHTPLNNDTRHSFGREQIETMKRTAFLINTSRGGIIKEDELIDCMNRKEPLLAGVGLDVTTTEPPDTNSLLWTLPNVYLTPHTGWRRQETRQRLVDMTYTNIEKYINASTPDDYINVVNK